MKNIESNSHHLEFDIPAKNAEEIWRKIVKRPGGMLDDILYLSGQYSEESEDADQTTADIRLHKKRKREGGGYLLYINDINKPNTQVMLNLLHKLEEEGLLIRSVNVQASHKSYDQMRTELIQKWDEYLQSITNH